MQFTDYFHPWLNMNFLFPKSNSSDLFSPSLYTPFSLHPCHSPNFNSLSASSASPQCQHGFCSCAFSEESLDSTAGHAAAGIVCIPCFSSPQPVVLPHSEKIIQLFKQAPCQLGGGMLLMCPSMSKHEGHNHKSMTGCLLNYFTGFRGLGMLE